MSTGGEGRGRLFDGGRATGWRCSRLRPLSRWPSGAPTAPFTTADLASLFLAEKSGSSKVGSVRILPENAPALSRLSLEEVEEFSSPEFKKMISMCRSKKPLLESIVEEPISSK
ncbi:hypothetical protein R6Q59_012427 [Mikania micrantha]